MVGADLVLDLLLREAGLSSAKMLIDLLLQVRLIEVDAQLRDQAIEDEAAVDLESL